MSWRNLRLGLMLPVLFAVACGRNQAMSDRMEMPDSMAVMRAMEDAEVMDSMLDTMPGGEMVRGDSVASMELLKKKM